jgi:hypothetical protein
MPALEQRGIVFVHFDEIDQVFDSEVGERDYAVISEAVDPNHAVLGLHIVGYIEEPVLVFAEILGDAANRRYANRAICGALKCA